MRTNLIALSFAAAVSVLSVSSIPASAEICIPFFGCFGPPDNGGGGKGGIHPTPGPLAGGLPFIAIGYGVYWLVRRRRAVNVFHNSKLERGPPNGRPQVFCARAEIFLPCLQWKS
jgi:hypothetical protein